MEKLGVPVYLGDEILFVLFSQIFVEDIIVAKVAVGFPGILLSRISKPVDTEL